MLVLTIFLSYSISCANNIDNIDIDEFAQEQMPYYIQGYMTEYQNYGFSSQSEMKNSQLGNPIKLYRIDQAAIENYTNGDIPLVDLQSWLYPIYGENNQIKNAIQISIKDGKLHSIFGGFTADVLNDYFQKNESLLKQENKSDVKAVLQEEISSLFLIYKENGRESVVYYSINKKMNYGLQDKKTYSSDELGQIYKERLNRQKENLKKIQKDKETIIGGGLILPPVNKEHSAKAALLVLLPIAIVGALIFFLINKKKSLNK